MAEGEEEVEEEVGAGAGVPAWAACRVVRVVRWVCSGTTGVVAWAMVYQACQRCSPRPAISFHRPRRRQRSKLQQVRGEQEE